MSNSSDALLRRTAILWLDRRYTEVEACETALRKVVLKTGPATRDQRRSVYNLLAT